MFKTKICKMCGAEYETDQNARKYCSEACYTKAHRESTYQAMQRYRSRLAEKKSEDVEQAKADASQMLSDWSEYLAKYKQELKAKEGTDFIRSQELHILRHRFEQDWKKSHELPEQAD